VRVFTLRAVLMLTLAILGTSAVSAGLALQDPRAGSDVTYMLVVMTVATGLVGLALLLTRGIRDAEDQPPAVSDPLAPSEEHRG